MKTIGDLIQNNELAEILDELLLSEDSNLISDETAFNTAFSYPLISSDVLRLVAAHNVHERLVDARESYFDDGDENEKECVGLEYERLTREFEMFRDLAVF